MNSLETSMSTEKLHSYTTRRSAPALPAWIILISNDERVSLVSADGAAAAAGSGWRAGAPPGWCCCMGSMVVASDC